MTKKEFYSHFPSHTWNVPAGMEDGFIWIWPPLFTILGMTEKSILLSQLIHKTRTEEIKYSQRYLLSEEIPLKKFGKAFNSLRALKFIQIMMHDDQEHYIEVNYGNVCQALRDNAAHEIESF